MSTKHVRTTGDLLRFGAGIRIECGACGQGRSLDALKAAVLLGSGPLRDAGRRLRCSHCQAKKATLTIIPPA